MEELLDVETSNVEKVLLDGAFILFIYIIAFLVQKYGMWYMLYANSLFHKLCWSKPTSGVHNPGLYLIFVKIKVPHLEQPFRVIEAFSVEIALLNCIIRHYIINRPYGYT